MKSAFVQPVKPLSECGLVNTPLATDLESGQLFTLDHTLRSALGHSQHESGLSESQKTQRLKLNFHRWCYRLSNANAIALISVRARSLGKAGALPNAEF